MPSLRTTMDYYCTLLCCLHSDMEDEDRKPTTPGAPVKHNERPLVKLTAALHPAPPPILTIRSSSSHFIQDGPEAMPAAVVGWPQAPSATPCAEVHLDFRLRLGTAGRDTPRILMEVFRGGGRREEEHAATLGWPS